MMKVTYHSAKEKVALIKNGVVENVVIIEPSLAREFYPEYGLVDVSDKCYVSPGFIYDGKDFSDPNQFKETKKKPKICLKCFMAKIKKTYKLIYSIWNN